MQLEPEKMINYTFPELFQFHKGAIRTESGWSGRTMEIGFNSIKVQLELLKTAKNLTKYLCFNSIKVQLEPFQILLRPKNNLFQFHKGAIRTLNLMSVMPSVLCFNSIKVQLELALNVCKYFRTFHVSIP